MTNKPDIQQPLFNMNMKSGTCVQKGKKGNLRSFPQKHLCCSPRNIQASEKSLKETFQSKEDSKVDL